MPEIQDGSRSTGTALGRDRAALFVTSRFISTLGDMAALAALSVYIYQAFDSATMVSGLFVVRVLPRLFGPLAGALADKYDIRRLLVLCDLAAGLLFAAIAAFQPSYWALLGMILVAESIATIATPSARTWVARRVPAEARGRFNGLLTAGIAIGFGAGAGVGGLTETAFGYRWALIINALSFVASAALVFAAGSVPPAPTTSGARPRLLSSAVAGTRLLLRDPRLSAVAIGLVGIGFAAAIDRPAVVALTQHDLSGSGAAYGLVLGMISLGALIASLSVGRLKALGVTRRVFLASIVVQALGHLGLGLAPLLALAAVTALVMGFGNGVESVVGATMLQSEAPVENVGTVVAAVVSITFIADAAGSLIGGPLVDTLGARPVFALAAALMAGCAAICWRITRRSPKLSSAKV